MTATIEKIARVRVAVAGDTVLLALDGLKEDVRIVADLPRGVVEQLTLDLLAAGFGPAARGGRA